MNLFGAVQRGLNIQHEVFRSDAIKKAAAAKQLRGLLHCAAQQQCPAGVVQSLGEVLDGMNAGGVDSRHITQPQNDHRLKGLNVRGGLDQLLGSAPEEWTVNAQQRDIGRQDASLQRVRKAIADVLVRHR